MLLGVPSQLFLPIIYLTYSFLFFPLCLGHSKLHSNNLRLRFRLISIGPLKTLLLLHSQPIKLLVSKLSVEYLS